MPTNSNQMAKNLKIGVVGGSIAGCTVAIELIRLGCDVTLFERSGDELRDRGAGIGVPPSVIDTFISRDLVDADIPYFPATNFSRIWRTQKEYKYGYLAWDQPAQLAALNWGALYRNLRARVPASVYRANQKIVSIHQGDEEVTLELADGMKTPFDLVVCADGYASLGRQTLFPEVQVKYAGYVLWRGFLMENELDEWEPLDTGIRCLGYPGGHGIFYFVPGPNGSVERGDRLVNWGMYVPVAESDIAAFLTDRNGKQWEGSLPPGVMPLQTERDLKDKAYERVPDYYADILRKSPDTFAYSIYDCEVPAYRKGRVCLAGDAGAFARPHSAAGALKGMNDAVSLSDAIRTHTTLEEALTEWNIERTEANNKIVNFGNQLGRALVKEIPDWSKMDATSMEKWFTSIVTMQTEYLPAKTE
ncbi:MAG: 2-polyprenyl-6-methoxyphenol hydroxylase-like FAD-dependent oxidoreductase [Gammaproteobacteria bacterium]|jgi:2-polyprenyl-6-methoxyphenol hydroxylase-like FAD-dependent oxidoreductase